MSKNLHHVRNTSSGHQLKVILWKNCLILKRHWLLTICEALIPVVLFLFISYGRSRITDLSKKNISEVSYNDKYPISYDNLGFNLENTMFYYSPSDKYFADILHRVQEKFQIINNNIKRFSSEKLLIESYLKGEAPTVVAIIFKSPPNSKQLDYTIRLHESSVNWHTNRLFEDVYSFQPGRGSGYVWKGFLTFQKALDLSFIEKEAERNKKHTPEMVLNSQEFPYPPYRLDLGSNNLFAHYLPLVTLFSFISVCPTVLQRVVEEKYTGVKELMKMVGMKTHVLWLGWLVYSIIPMLVSICLIVVLLKVDIFNAGYPPIEYTSAGILTLFLILYCVTITLNTFFLSTLFQKPTLATLVGFLFWILSYFVPRYVTEDVCDLPFYACALLMLFPNMALHFGFSAISQYEIREIGLQWTNWHIPGGGYYNNLSMVHVCAMLLMDCLLFSTLTLYIDPLNPGKYGVPQSVFIPKWIKRSKRPASNMNVKSTSDVEQGLLPPVGIAVRNLSKSYGNREVVKNVSMDIHKNTITVLLGPNGAGKSTIMGMITGMVNKTSGEIYMNGEKIQSGSGILPSVGLCPQYNLFFSDLTVREHLTFIAMLKGQNSQETKEEIDELLMKLKLEHKKHKLPHTLSGGMQRKLSLAMAIVGRSEILILDEPSAGMDPQARRDMEHLLLELRHSKTILVTTHFMDEVDTLADRVIIFDDGKTVFEEAKTLIELKQKYGADKFMRLLIEKNADINKTQLDIEHKIQNFAKVSLENIDGNQIKFRFCSENVVELLKDLESHKDKLHIEAISIYSPSVEDVLEEYHNSKRRMNQINKNTKYDIRKSSGASLCPQLKGLCYKRLSFLWEKIISHIIAVVFAAAFLLLSIGLGQARSLCNVSGPNLNLSLMAYSNSTVLCGGLNSSLICHIESEDLLEHKLANMKFENDVSSAIVELGTKNLLFYQRRMIAASEFSKSDQDCIEATALYNGLAIHSAPISLNLLTNTIAKQVLGNKYGISASIHPFKSIDSNDPEQLYVIQIGLLWLIIVPMGFLFFLGSFIYFPHKEISTNFTQIQFISGIQPFLYWLSTYILDFLFYSMVVTTLSCLILLWTPFQGMRELGSFCVILILYGCSGVSFSYLFSRRKSFSSSYALFVILNVMLGVLQTVLVLAAEESKDDAFMNVATYLKIIFSIFSPQFGLTYSGVVFSKKAVTNYNIEKMDNEILKHMCYRENPSPCCSGPNEACDAEKSYWTDLTTQAWCMPLGGLLFLLLTIIFDSYTLKCITGKFTKCFRKNKSSNLKAQKNNYQMSEQRGDNSINSDMFNSGLFINNLTKSYWGKNVVNNVKFAVGKGNCVGILGKNGAGKSTTFRLLTKQVVPDNVSITIFKNGVTKSYEYLNSIGYCPQNDALNHSLTGRQLISSIVSLRGLATAEVENVLNVFGLSEIADIPCGHYSGGNKRKLSFAIAIIGLPDFILLDEPTNGVDPLFKKKLWTLIRDIKNQKKVSFILTSHSMAECEALCNKVYIIENGEVKTEGSILELKQKQGFFNVTLHIQVERENEMERLCKYIRKLGGDVTDKHRTRLTFKAKSEKCSLATLYAKCEGLKGEFKELIIDYAINDLPLEQVFLNGENTQDCP